MKNDKELGGKLDHLSVFVVFLSSAWKNVGMAMTCNRCVIMCTKGDIRTRTAVPHRQGQCPGLGRRGVFAQHALQSAARAARPPACLASHASRAGPGD